MLPIILDPSHINALVIGKGPATSRRLEMLEAAGVKNIKYFESCPDEKEFAAANILYVADFDDKISAEIHAIALKYKLLVNTEDKKPFCNFHVPAIIRRGALLITVSTAATSPRLARRLKRIFENMFPPVWGEHMEKLSGFRDKYKSEGYNFTERADKIDEDIDKMSILKSFSEWDK